MTQFRKSAAAAAAGLAALTLLAAPGFANSEHHGVRDAAAAQSAPARVPLAHMGQSPTGGPGMMGQGPTGAPGMTAPGQDCGPGYGVGPCQGHGPGYGMAPGQGYGPGFGMTPSVAPDKDLSAADVRDRLERSLTWHGSKRLKAGEVKEADDDTIVAEIVTQDGSLVQRFKVDRHTGRMQQAE